MVSFVVLFFVLSLFITLFIVIKFYINKQYRDRETLICVLKTCPELPDIVKRHQDLLKDAREVLLSVLPDTTCHDMILLDLMEDALKQTEEK